MALVLMFRFIAKWLIILIPLYITHIVFVSMLGSPSKLSVDVVLNLAKLK